MQLDDLLIEVRNGSRDRVGIVPLHNLVASKISSARFVPKHCATGEWEIVLPSGSALATLIGQRGYGIVLTGPAGPIMSGNVDKITPTRTAQDPEGILRIHGVDDTVLCWQSNIRPTPGAALDAQTVDQYVITDDAETVMYDLVNNNFGPGALSARRGPLASDVVLGTNLARGATYTSRCRFDLVGDELVKIAKLNNFGFRIVQKVIAGSESLEFEVYETTDRSDLIRLTLQNRGLESIEYEMVAPTLTRPQIAGQGEGADRTIIEHTNAASLASETTWGFHIEQFIDRRDTDDSTELAQEGEAQLADKGEKITPRIVPADAPNMVIGRDWQVGDRIAVDATETVVTVQSALINIDSAGVTCATALS